MFKPFLEVKQLFLHNIIRLLLNYQQQITMFGLTIFNEGAYLTFS